MNNFLKKIVTSFALALILISCSSTDDSTELFRSLPSSETGINFENSIIISDSINVQTDAFLYNGAGVAIGDVNNDGLPDIFFSGNMVSSKLYINQGNFTFKDITETSGISTNKWVTGASMVDINNDGYLDIYLSVSGPEWRKPSERANLLYINNGDQTYTEKASEYNIDDTGFTTHAVFFDYDGDGYLDLYLLSNSPGEFRRGESGTRVVGIQQSNPDGFDRLYRNNGDGTFSNVSDEAGLLRKLGYGLGVAVADLNNDGWADIYVSNDITPNDVLYINNADGTFTDKAAEWLRHTSFAGMGVDIADFNNDGRLDIMQNDMMPEDINARKRMSGSTTYAGFIELRQAGYYPHYNQNTLQLNQGASNSGAVNFSEISRMAGVAYTDWSWSALFADFNNSGYKDLLITNGYPIALNDFDFQSESHVARQTNDPIEAKKREQEILDNLHAYHVPNYMFKNNQDLTFSNVSSEWGIDLPAYSYSAAYADLNNNGWLDFVVSNIDQEAFVFENISSETDSLHFLQIILNGESPNRRGIGSKVYVYAEGETQYIYHMPYRGFMSTVDDRIHFGMGHVNLADSLKIVWPDGRVQQIYDVETDQKITVHQTDAFIPAKEPQNNNVAKEKLFREVLDDTVPKIVHRETSSVDFGVQSTLPYQLSKQGPPLAVADVTGNGLDDLYVGGDRGIPGVLYLQKADGSFVESDFQQSFAVDSEHEDTAAIFFDANGDGNLDLYVTSGGYQSSPISGMLQDRLYINYGNGRFLNDEQALPEMLTSTSSVAAGDFTGDGQTDLFVGGRLTPRNYPSPTRSWLLQNNNGRFTDVTDQAAPYFTDPGGMITDAAWADFNNDGQLDLVTVGEWMPVQFFENNNGKLTDVTTSLNIPLLHGWWNSIATGDFNNDGYADFVAGNLGLNHTYTASPEEPFGMYANDFDQNGDTEIILTKTINSVQYPFHGLAYLGQEIYTLGLRFDSFESFSTSAITDIFSRNLLDSSIHKQANTFASYYFINNGDGSFTHREMPKPAQISAVQTILINDFNRDEIPDILIAGNLFDTEPNIPRADAGSGLLLTGNGNGDFTPVSGMQSGFLTPGNARNSSIINTLRGPMVAVTNNNGKLQFFRLNNKSTK